MDLATLCSPFKENLYRAKFFLNHYKFTTYFLSVLVFMFQILIDAKTQNKHTSTHLLTGLVLGNVGFMS